MESITVNVWTQLDSIPQAKNLEELKVIEQSLALGCTDAAAVRHLLTAMELVRPRAEVIAPNGQERYERPLPLMNEYDQLLGIAAVPAEVAR